VKLAPQTGLYFDSVTVAPPPKDEARRTSRASCSQASGSSRLVADFRQLGLKAYVRHFLRRTGEGRGFAVAGAFQADVRVIHTEHRLHSRHLRVDVTLDLRRQVIALLEHRAGVEHGGVAAVNLAILQEHDAGSRAQRRTKLNFV
jgi:hypothetical protein